MSSAFKICGKCPVKNFGRTSGSRNFYFSDNRIAQNDSDNTFKVPKIAGLFSKSSFAYDYLPHSVEHFPQTDAFTAILKKNGFKRAEFFPMTMETSILYVASK